MAKLIIDGKEYEIVDGTAIADACWEAGVPFDCNSGVCGSCRIKILQGAENLSELTAEEKDLGFERHTRLACRCSVLKGIVKATY